MSSQVPDLDKASLNAARANEEVGTVRTEAGLLHDIALAELCSERLACFGVPELRASSVAAGENLFCVGAELGMPDGGWVFQRRSGGKTGRGVPNARDAVNARSDYSPSIPAERRMRDV